MRWSAASSSPSPLRSSRDSLLSPSPNITNLQWTFEHVIMMSPSSSSLTGRHWAGGMTPDRWSPRPAPASWAGPRSPCPRPWCGRPCCRSPASCSLGSAPHMSPSRCVLRIIVVQFIQFIIWHASLKIKVLKHKHSGKLMVNPYWGNVKHKVSPR